MRRLFIFGAFIVSLQCLASGLEAQHFSVETGTFDTAGFTPPGDDILSPGPFPILPATGVFGALDVDAFSYGRPRFLDRAAFDFSVDFFSTGIAGSGSGVDIEVSTGGFGEQNFDVFRSSGTGTNFQIHDGNGVGPGGTAFPLGMFEPQAPATSPFGTGVDGYDNRSAIGPVIYWSWDPFTAGPGSLSPADILISPAIPGFPGFSGIYASDAMLGLLSGDNIDALEIYDGGVVGSFDPGDTVIFSLDPTSPTLGILGASPADLLFATPGSMGVYLPAGALGLAPTDNITALSQVPEPGSSMFFVVGLSAFAISRRRRQAFCIAKC